MELETVSRRLDFEIEISDFDEKTGIVEFKLIPNKTRYEWQIVEGEEVLYDRLDRVYIHKSALRDLAQQVRGIPIFYQPPLVDDVNAYVESRRSLVSDYLKGNQDDYEFADASEDFLRSLNSSRHEFAIVSVDVVGSTRLSQSIDEITYARVISAIQHELSEIIPLYRGYVLKFVGDGLVAYFPAPSFASKNDLAVLCTTTMLRVVHEVIRPATEAMGVSNLDVRIGLDSGNAVIKSIGSKASKQHQDIIGQTVNLACKVQAKAEPGSISIGESAYRNIHTNYRIHFALQETGDNWPYKDEYGNVYGIYKLVGSYRALATWEANSNLNI